MVTRLAPSKKIEYLPIVGGEIKATHDRLGIIEGYLNYTGNIDYSLDRTMPGAFKRTLADSYARKAAQGGEFLFPYLWNHSHDIIPPGGIFEANEDKKGLYTKTQLNMDIQLGREIYSSFRMGTLRKQSIGYRTVQSEYVKEDGQTIRNLLEITLLEGSAVIFPANDLATVDVVKRRSVPGWSAAKATPQDRLSRGIEELVVSVQLGNLRRQLRRR
jgi:HK97 family phage prohead protease